MRSMVLIGMSLMFLFVLFSPHKAAAASQVQISQPFVNVYEYLDPKSTVLKLAKKGDCFPLVYAGPAWYQVDMGGKVGWIERKAGNVIEKASFFSPVVSIILVLVVFGGAIFAVSYFRKEQKTA